jgi:hypothetical protein
MFGRVQLLDAFLDGVGAQEPTKGDRSLPADAACRVRGLGLVGDDGLPVRPGEALAYGLEQPVAGDVEIKGARLFRDRDAAFWTARLRRCNLTA